MRKAVAITSGGLDSTTLLHWLLAEGYQVHALAFNYGQRHAKELRFAAIQAQRGGATFDVLDLTVLRPLLHGSALTDSTIAVPHGHYAAPNMAVTIVPNRNAVMLAIAYAVAVAEDAAAVALGIHAGDHPIYPDCRPEFAAAFASMETLATGREIALLAPFSTQTKSDIVVLGARLGVDYAATWSCYQGGDVHCGLCGTCQERREAFQLAGVPDPTLYAA